jgi:hypothetical protein
MPVYSVLGMWITVASIMAIVWYMVVYGTKRDVLILLAVAWVIVIILWRLGI